MNSEDYVLKFEAVKTSFRQTRDGYHLTLVLHPNDVPNELYTSWVGTRYQCVMVELNDQDKPVERDGVEEGRRAVAVAAQLCRSTPFQQYIADITGADFHITRHDAKSGSSYTLGDEEAAAVRLRSLCGGDSRADFTGNPLATEKLLKLKEAYLSSDYA